MTTQAERLDAAVTVLEALGQAGYYLHDAAGQCLTKDEFIAAVTVALDRVIDENAKENAKAPARSIEP